jgi:hypothetical protein
MMKSILLAAFAALASAASDAEIWFAACKCINNSRGCTRAADVDPAIKAIFKFCNEDMPGSKDVVNIDIYYECTGNPCKDSKPCCEGS